MPIRQVLKILFSLLVLLISSHGLLVAQTNETRLVDWLQSIEKEYNISFSYNHSLLDNFLVERSKNTTTLQESLNYIQTATSVRFESNGENSFLIVPVRASANFKVVDEETGESIISLKVKVNNQPQIYLLPKEETYELPNLFLTDSIQITSRFYSQSVLTAKQLFELKKPLLLTPDTVYLNEVLVEGYLTSGIDSKLSDHSIQVDMTDLGLLAGETDGDILNLLKAIPGIRTPDGKPGSLNFRGSTFDQTLIYFDDIPIYHSGHFFGSISPYNAAIVNKIEVHRGTLPAKWGGRVGGLINLQTNNQIADSAEYKIVLNTVYAGASIKTPILKNKLGISISARSNYPIDQLSPKLQAFSDLNFQGSKVDPIVLNGQQNKVLDQFDVRFNDLNGKLVYQINKKQQATFSFMNIDNNFVYNFNSIDQNLIEIQTSDLDNWGLTGKWNAQPSNKTKVEASLTQSNLRIYEENTETENGLLRSFDEVTNTIKDFRLNTNISYQVTNNSLLEAGYSFANVSVNHDETSDGSKPENDRYEAAKIHSIYLASKHNWGTRLVTNIGLHSDYYSELNNFFIDPRISISYRASDFVFLKMSGGRSHQFIKQQLKNDFDDFRLQNQFWLLIDNKRPVLEGYQGMIGLLFDRSGWIVDLELYSKKTNGITTQTGTMMDQEGSLLTTGVDLFVKRKWGQFESWISYSLSHTQTEFDTKETAFFDQRHLINLTNQLHLSRWNVALSWSYKSGMPVVLPDLDPDHSNSNGQTSLSIPYTNNFPAQHQLDLSITYKFWNKSEQWRGIIGLTLLNLYDEQNIINVFQNNPRVEDPFRRAVGFAPNINLNLSF